MKLSIIIPVFNEAGTLLPLLQKVAAAPLPEPLVKELIIVDDASTDGSTNCIEEFQEAYPHLSITVLRHATNSGKGSCIHTGIRAATGDFILVQDADLEYDPNDYGILLQPVLEGRADVVFGSRFVGGRPHRILFFWHSLGNKILTGFSNMLTNLNLTDMENGYKLFRADILKSLELKELRFGFEPEVTARLAAIPGIRIYEVGVAYYGRTYEEGKKINWKDGLRAIHAILKYNLFTGQKTFQPRQGLLGNRWVYAILLLFLVAGIGLIATARGTGDEGDSIMHYLYARHAWQYPDFFFYHWAKPLFVLIASPFAQLGMTGMKAFNLGVSTLTLFLSYATARKLALPNAWLVPLCMAFAPWLMIITLSGLTEPLFALWMIAGIYGLLKGFRVSALVWLSFLPFVRSEGLIILCVLLFYLIDKKWYRFLPLLLVGHLVYALAGLVAHDNFLWVFTEMSYATLSSAYGQGTWSHFFLHMPQVLGKVVCTFLVLGIVYGLIRLKGRLFFGQRGALSPEELWLVYGIFAAYFLGHTIFWALGIFNSFGLVRVMIGVLPLIGIIAARGFNLLASVSSQPLYRPVLYGSLVLLLAYPFLGRGYSFNWQRDFSLKADQEAEEALAGFVRSKFPDYQQKLFFYEASYLSVALNINYFDSTSHRRLLNAFERNDFPSGSFVVWDDWFAPVEGRIEEGRLEGDGRFDLLGEFSRVDPWGVSRRVKLFRVK